MDQVRVWRRRSIQAERNINIRGRGSTEQLAATTLPMAVALTSSGLCQCNAENVVVVAIVIIMVFFHLLFIASVG